MPPDDPTLLTADYRKTALARAVPDSFFQDGGWWLPPDPDPDSCRVALRLFPALGADPELVARAALSAVDYTPIDYSTARWVDRPLSADPWQHVLSAMENL